MAAQTLRGSEGPGIGDVPVGLVVELEAPAPVPGLQDTRSGGNRVSSTSSGTSRLTIRAEQKSGHFTLTWLRDAGRIKTNQPLYSMCRLGSLSCSSMIWL